MNTKWIAYWLTTAIIGFETVAGGLTDLFHGRVALVSGPYAVEIITHLGYPSYLLTILGVWKVLGGMVLFVPGLPRIKEWAYAGIVFELTGAAASWTLHGDSAVDLISPLVLTAFALASWALRPSSRTVRSFRPSASPL